MDNYQQGNVFSNLTNEIEVYNSLDVKQPTFSEVVFKNQKKEILDLIEKNKTSKSEKSSVIIPQNRYILVNVVKTSLF